MANSEIDGQYDIGTLYWDSTEGYTFETDKGDYEMLEGVSLSGAATSDIVFIMFYPNGITSKPQFVAWFYGANNFDFEIAYEYIQHHYNSIA